MRRKIFAGFILAGFLACNAKQPPYLKHKLVKWEKVSSGCKGYQSTFKMESTLIGERYQFQKCLGANYNGLYTAERIGDTVNVRFEKATGATSLYSVVLDIETFPPYRFLTIDGTTFAIIPTQN